MLQMANKDAKNKTSGNNEKIYFKCIEIPVSHPPSPRSYPTHTGYSNTPAPELKRPSLQKKGGIFYYQLTP